MGRKNTMIVNMQYSQSELDAAVDFISKNNEHFLGQKTHIRDAILETINDMAKSARPNDGTCCMGSMGYLIHVEYFNLESIELDENTVGVSILIDPSLGKRDGDEKDNKIKKVILPIKESK